MTCRLLGFISVCISREWILRPGRPRRKDLEPSRNPYIFVTALTPREALSKANTLRDISESTTFSLASHLTVCLPFLSVSLSLFLCLCVWVCDRTKRQTRHRRGDDFQRNSRLTRHRPIAHQSASVCRPAGAGWRVKTNIHPCPRLRFLSVARTFRENGAGSIRGYRGPILETGYDATTSPRRLFPMLTHGSREI